MQRTLRLLGAGACLVLGLGPDAAAARDLFTSVVTVPGEGTATLSTNEIRDVPDLFESTALSVAFGAAIDPNDPIDAVIDLRGLPSLLSYDGAGTLSFEVPGVVAPITFSGSDRDVALDAFVDWISGEDDAFNQSVFSDLLHELVAQSPVDPVAGNPNSLQSKMFANDFRVGSEGPFRFAHRADDDYEVPAINLLRVGAEVGRYDADDFDVESIDLPIDYRLHLGPRASLVLDLPLTATRTEGQWSAMGSLGLGLQLRPCSCWSITPLVRIGAVGSRDVGALAAMWSASVTSHLHWTFWGVTLGIGNMAGVARTLDGIEVRGLEFEYDLTNPVVRNGGSLSGDLPVELGDKPLGWKVFGSDTRFFGDDLYLDNQDEVGGALLLRGHTGGAPYEALSLSASYVFDGSDRYDGFQLRLTGRF